MAPSFCKLNFSISGQHIVRVGIGEMLRIGVNQGALVAGVTSLIWQSHNTVYEWMS